MRLSTIRYSLVFLVALCFLLTEGCRDRMPSETRVGSEELGIQIYPTSELVGDVVMNRSPNLDKGKWTGYRLYCVYGNFKTRDNFPKVVDFYLKEAKAKGKKWAAGYTKDKNDNAADIGNGQIVWMLDAKTLEKEPKAIVNIESPTRDITKIQIIRIYYSKK